jgi:hypothetical protein
MNPTWRNVVDVQNMPPTVPLPNNGRQILVEILLEVEGNVVRMRGFSDARICTQVHPTCECNCSKVLLSATYLF